MQIFVSVLLPLRLPLARTLCVRDLIHYASARRIEFLKLFDQVAVESGDNVEVKSNTDARILLYTSHLHEILWVLSACVKHNLPCFRNCCRCSWN